MRPSSKKSGVKKKGTFVLNVLGNLYSQPNLPSIMSSTPRTNVPRMSFIIEIESSYFAHISILHVLRLNIGKSSDLV
jgi:hypothetical protein